MLILLTFQSLGAFLLYALMRSQQRRQKLSQLHDHTGIPLVSKVLKRASGGPIADPKLRFGANIFKRSVRAYVNSDLFDQGVNGLFNEKSLYRRGYRFLQDRMQSQQTAAFISQEAPVSVRFR